MSTTRWPDALSSAALAALVCLLAACARPSNQAPTQQARTVGAFDAIELRGGARLDVLIGPAPSLVASGGADAVAGLESRVVGGTLVLQSRRRALWLWGPRESVQLRVTVPSLRSLTVNGATSATLNGVAGEELTLLLNGASSLEASGSIGRLDARLSGAGSMDLSRLTARSATVEANGAGSIRVNVTGALDARVNGVGSIHYGGSPAEVRTAINGLGSIAAE